jgi:hypothetical protein
MTTSVYFSAETPDGEAPASPAPTGTSEKVSKVSSARSQSLSGVSFSGGMKGAYDDDDDEIERGKDGKDRILMPSVQEYWHTYASWLSCWPLVTEVRSDMETFIREWKKQKSKGIPQNSFCVVHHTAIRIRSDATWQEEQCTGSYLRPGQCFFVSEIVKEDDVNYLKLADNSGWVFDNFDKIPMCARMEGFEFGQWWYTIISENFVEVRSAPSEADDSRNGWIMCPEEVTLVSLRCNFNGHRFIFLADGRGWLFEETKRSQVKVMAECTTEEQVNISERKRVSVTLDDDAPVKKISSTFNFAGVTSTKSRKGGANSQADVKEKGKKLAASGKIGCFSLCGRVAN